MVVLRFDTRFSRSFFLHILFAHIKIIVIDNDLGTSTSSADVAKTFPNNFWELGIGEQSSLSAATGLALEGMLPVYVNFAIFATGTIWTQIRQAAYAKANLKIIATHPGLDAGPDGASHQATQDMALMRCVPNMNVILPLDENDVKSAINYALNNKGIIANPNCSTIQAMLPLKALDDKYHIKRIVYSTYQAVSGAGKDALDDLANEDNSKPLKKFPHPIYNNCLPHIPKMNLFIAFMIHMPY